MHKQEYRGGPVASATPQRVESTLSVEAAMSAAIEDARGWRRLVLEPRDGGVPAPILKSRTRHACRYSKTRRRHACHYRLATLDRLPLFRPDMANLRRNPPIQLELDSPVRNSTFPRNFRCSEVRDQRIQVARAAASPRPRTSLALVRQPTLKEQNRDHLGRKDARDQA